MGRGVRLRRSGVADPHDVIGAARLRLAVALDRWSSSSRWKANFPGSGSWSFQTW